MSPFKIGQSQAQWPFRNWSLGVPLVQQAILGKITPKECLDRFADVLKKEMT